MSVWDWVVAAGLVLGLVVYVVGFLRLRRRAGETRTLGVGHLAAFLAGLASVVLALLSPLDTLSDFLFSAHMSQHEILMLVSAPLAVMGKPWVAVSWGLPAAALASREGVTARARLAPLRAVWRRVTHPIAILVLHALALWIWHVPSLFEGAMHSEAVHALQHLCFFATAVLFWWALVRGRYGRSGYGAAVVFVFLTALHSGVLGALITFAGQLWYPIYAERAPAAGLAPLEDQQLAGLIMWIPAGFLLMVVALGLFLAWLGEADRRARRAGPLAGRLVSKG